MKLRVHQVERNKGLRVARPINASNAKDLDGLLIQILTSFAEPLLRNGYGFRHFNTLARSAFVRAAEELNSEFRKHSSTAKIAAVTGLTRVEVSKLRKSSVSMAKFRGKSLSRAIRIAAGWRSDKAFFSGDSRPNLLAFSSRGQSFTKLVKKYGGDVPARAMLGEMKRLQLVRETASGQIQLVRGSIRARQSTVEAMRAISPWVNFFRHSGSKDKTRNLTSSARQFSLHFESLPQVFAAARELEERRQSFVTGLELLGTETKKTSKYALTVSVALAASKPKLSTANVTDRRKDEARKIKR